MLTRSSLYFMPWAESWHSLTTSEEWQGLIRILLSGGYDGGDHAPKLIPCSHTVCVSCLQVWPPGSVCWLTLFFVEDRCHGRPPARVQVTDISVELWSCLLIISVSRCPICRELIRIPPGGVLAFPPSFIVNQLIDLMARQIREVVPNCSHHQNQVRTLHNHHSLFYNVNLSHRIIRPSLDDIPLDNEDKEKSQVNYR